MSNKVNHSKKWLISRLKTSGSKREYITNGSYAEDRQRMNSDAFDDLPKFESISRSTQFYNGKINDTLLKRFLETQIGLDWDEVYEKIQERIPTKLKEYHQVICWFVADRIKIVDDKAFDLREQKFINFDKVFVVGNIHKDFVVSPDDNKLYRFSDFGDKLKADYISQ
ncbi:hypothetical protein [Fibrella forsythiae]|uniref:DUF4238 domain-containing protein n=1 Tax=Fibrella forsythiae TaxID=2817061 RepID=A0ABS3JP46_9BACT|nr:hypothetical protein [Fibrella forsythiae]MBO0950687.1 hypothetical protein [Fibrella forsythiae]